MGQVTRCRGVGSVREMIRFIFSLVVAALVACSCTTEEGAFEEEVLFRSGGVGVLETVTQFDPSQLETPESLDFDRSGNIYVSLALTGEIRKIEPDGTESTLVYIPIGTPLEQCHNYLAIMGALVVHHDELFVTANACDLDSRGVWRVELDSGDASLVASAPATALLNGITVRFNRLYMADSGAGRIWTAPTDGEGAPMTVWATTPLLDPVPNPFGAPGANGIQQHLNEFLIANSSAQTIVAIPTHGGHAGTPYVKYQSPPGCDDFAVDVLGRIYCTTDPFQTVMRINTDGSIQTLFGAADGLDGPTSARFGKFDDVRTVYVTNAAFPFFPSTGNGPSVQKFEVDLPGYPL